MKRKGIELSLLWFSMVQNDHDSKTSSKFNQHIVNYASRVINDR